MKVIVGMTGATGSIYGLRLLETLRRVDGVETHLITSRWARTTIGIETGRDINGAASLADVVHDPRAPGSVRADAMIVLPCSMKALAAIQAGYDESQMGRAADAVRTACKPLVLGVRETPLSTAHLENMLALARSGVTIMPPTGAFHHRPRNLEDLVSHYIVQICDQAGIDVARASRRTTRPLP